MTEPQPESQSTATPPYVRHDYGGTCWWCGNAADSREHRHKKSDVVREFGPGSWKNENAVVRVVSGQRPENLQGPQARGLKFEKVLCADCNNARSQRFDLAYDTFSGYIRENENTIVNDKRFRFSSIYGADWQAARRQLERYFAKHACCRLAEDGVLIPDALTSYFDDASLPFPPHLQLKMEARDDIVELIARLQKEGGEDGNLWLGDSQATYSKSQQKITQVYSFIGYRWLRLNYLYDATDQRGRTNFDSDLVILPSGRNLTSDEVANFEAAP